MVAKGRRTAVRRQFQVNYGHFPVINLGIYVFGPLTSIHSNFGPYNIYLINYIEPTIKKYTIFVLLVEHCLIYPFDFHNSSRSIYLVSSCYLVLLDPQST